MFEYKRNWENISFLSDDMIIYIESPAESIEVKGENSLLITKISINIIIIFQI